jgi:hypothetical protein
MVRAGSIDYTKYITTTKETKMKPSNDREAITLILQGMVDKGHSLTSVNDGEENYPVSTVEEAVGHVTDVDIATVEMTNKEGEYAWIWFVLGNDPEEVASDYTTNLDPDLRNIVDPWWK